MSIKDLFDNKGVPKIQKSVNSDDLVANVESKEFVDSKRYQHEEFVPPIDFASASNFAKFGSAELYYEKAFERIHNYYPYDGTLHEKIEFENSSSYLDKHVFDNLYPRTNGYLNFYRDIHISVFGGPHTASSGMDGKVLHSTFENSMVYDESKKRTSAFEFRGEDGITAEFWFKAVDNVNSYNIFEISGSTNEGTRQGIKLEQEGQDLKMTISSGSATAFEPDFEGIIVDNEWNHYAVSVVSSSTGLVAKAYKNGQLFEHHGPESGISHILPSDVGLQMRIGKNFDNARILSGSLDEFRFWKTERTSEQIFNSWFNNIGGGTNKNDANISLGCYFKFNEGITGNSSLDQTVLDYSGRINNGFIHGYTSVNRSTGSAITEKLGEPEFLDPIVYSSHPDVVSTKARYKASGSLSDLESSSTLYSYFPGWMQEEDEQNGKQLKFLSQVMGSYFDTLWHQISFVNKIHDNYCVSGSNKALPFAKKLLYNKGFVIPDLFVDANLVELLRKKDDNEIYEKEINEVRNLIYHNIYNNLDAIYKSKGTEKSFRNFFRSVGIGQDLVKLNLYADDSTYVLRDNYEYKSLGKKYLDFNVNGHFDATIYQTTSSNKTTVYLDQDPDTSRLGSFTLETELILPRKQKKNQINYNPYPYVSASVAGYHTGTSYTHPSLPDGLQIYVVQSGSESSMHPEDKQRIKFALSGSGVYLETDWFGHQYENNKWNVAVKLKHSAYPRVNVAGITTDDYLLEFYGVEADGNTERNTFTLTQTGIAHSYYSSNKIFYAGSHRDNFKGTTLQHTDIKLGYLRYWHSYLSNEAIKQHAFDSETFGANDPHEQDISGSYGSMELPREKTLAFHWTFDDLTTSNSYGEFDVTDFSSGSTNNNYGNLSDLLERTIPARGFGFNNSSKKIVDKMFVQTARKRRPDDLMSSDLITVQDDETENFFVDDDVSDNFYSFEKSLWGTISDEMLNMFSTALDLNNLIGQPSQKYHHSYNLIDFLKNRFFDDVKNEPDLEKFSSFYKWIDDSISIAMQQLVPASSRFSSKINNIIESHALERNKYVHQIPILTEFRSTEGSIKGIAEMKYNWRFGHAPTNPDDESNHVLWQVERKQKPTESLRETLRVSRNNHSLQSAGLRRKEIDGSTRVSDTYSIRKFAKTLDIGLSSQETIYGGTNFGRKKNLQLFHESVAPAGALGTVTSVPQNIITVGVGAGSGIVQEVPNNDLSPRKKKYNLNVLIGNKADSEYGYKVNGNSILPVNIMSGTVNSGFNFFIETSYSSGVHVANLHNDVVGNYNETSMQGPFTEQHVGGLQYRHIDLNQGSDAPLTRPEGWTILLKDHNYLGPDSDGALGFVGPDYEAPYPSKTLQKANRYREEHAKRPLNFKNIKTTSTTKRAGNYKNELELFSLSPTFQKTWAIKAYQDPNVNILPVAIANALPKTTHYQSLLGVSPIEQGNTFGVYENNRQSDAGLTSPSIAGTFASGSFVVTGSPSVPVAATGSFFLTSSPSPPAAPGTAKFDLFGIETATESSVLVITKSAGAIFPFEIDLDSSIVNVGYTSISGATDTIFWNDMSSSLSSSLSPDYTISYVPHAATRSIAVSTSADTLSRLHSSNITAGGGGTAGYAVSFWMYFDTFGSDRIKTIYQGRAASTDTTKYIYIESGSLFFESVWRDDGGLSGDEFSDTFKISNFTSSYNGSLNHFSFSHSGSMGQGNQLILYINGVSSSALTVDSLAQSKGSATPGPFPYVDLATTEITLFAKHDGSNSLFPAGSTGPIYLDEVVVYPEARPHDHMIDLYNGGKWQSSKPGSPTMIMDFEGLTVGTAITNGQIIQDAGVRNNDLTASITSLGDLVPLTSSGVSKTIIKTPSSASFEISNAPIGADFNLTLNLESPLNTFTNIQNAAGGVNYGASYGIVDGDKLTLSGSGDVRNFFLTSSSPGDSAPNFYIELTGTGDQIHTSLRDKMNAVGLTTTTFISGSEQAFFMVTASTAGASGNSLDLAEVGTSITSIIGLSGGLDSGSTGGIQNSDTFRYDTAGVQKNFIFSYTVQSDSDPNYYIVTTGSSAEIWHSLEDKIKAVTGETVNVDSSALTEASFSITSSVTGSDRNRTLAEVGTGITSVVGMLGGTSFIPAIYNLSDNTIASPRTDLTGSERNIVTRFSAPGGPEIQTISYLDAYTSTYSVHNALPFRNSSVLGSGSGEQNTIRVDDHLGLRRGLRTLRALHMGRFGIDSQYGSVSSTQYPSSGSFNKQHRNTSRRHENGPVVDIGSATQASGSIRMTDTGPSTPQSYAGGVFRIISGDGTNKAYVYRNGGGFSSGDLDGSNVVVQVNGESFETVGAQVVIAIQSPNGHQGKMTATATGASNGSTIVVVEADQVGTAGNSASITNTSCGAKFVVDPGSGVAFNNGAAFVSNLQQTLITGSNHDNAFINTPIPRMEFQYSWINSAIPDPLDGTQHILGYAPKDGIVSSSAGYVEAIVFPTASTIYPQ